MTTLDLKAYRIVSIGSGGVTILRRDRTASEQATADTVNHLQAALTSVQQITPCAHSQEAAAKIIGAIKALSK